MYFSGIKRVQGPGFNLQQKKENSLAWMLTFCDTSIQQAEARELTQVQS